MSKNEVAFAKIRVMVDDDSIVNPTDHVRFALNISVCGVQQRSSLRIMSSLRGVSLRTLWILGGVSLRILQNCSIR